MKRIVSTLATVLLAATLTVHCAVETETVKKTHKYDRNAKNAVVGKKTTKKVKTSPEGEKTVTEKTTTKTPRATETSKTIKKTKAAEPVKTKATRTTKTTTTKSVKTPAQAPASESTFSDKVAAFAAPLGLGAGAATTHEVASERHSHKNVLAALESDSELSAFTQALKKYGYAEQLQYTHTKFTVFAPTNKAMARANITPALIESHIVEGKEALRLRTLETRKRLNTSAHKQRKVEYKDRHVYIDGVKLSSDHEIVTDNGVIYIIDTVLESK